MRKLLCKIFRFVLNLFTQVVNVIAEAVTIVGEAVVDVLSDLLQAAGNALSDIFKASPLLTIALIGGVAWWLFGGSDDDESSSTDTVRSTVSSGGVNV